MKKSSSRIGLVAFGVLFFAATAYAQAQSTISKIETLLKKNQPSTKSVSMAGGFVIIDQKSKGVGFGFQVPYDSVDYSFTFSTKSKKDTTFNVNIKCPNNKDCIVIYDDDKEFLKKNIWISFKSEPDAETFISLMGALKEGK